MAKSVMAWQKAKSRRERISTAAKDQIHRVENPATVTDDDKAIKDSANFDDENEEQDESVPVSDATDTDRLKDDESKLSVNQGKIGGAGVFLEDAPQFVCVILLERIYKADAIPGGASFDFVAKISVAATVLNILFKGFETWQRARKGSFPEVVGDSHLYEETDIS